ncbi:MAG: glycosyltransferase family 4 protein [Calditrichaceae bacterium]
MEAKSLKILHIDTEKEWRGGQQQAVYLHRSLIEQGYSSDLACQPGSRYESYCIENQLPCLAVNMRGEYDFIAGWKIAGYCRKNRVHIIHAHSAHALAIGLWAKMFYSDIKLIAARRVDFSIRKNMFSVLKYKNSFLDKIVCVSDNIKSVLVADGLPEHKITTVHSGIDLNKFDSVQVPDGFLQDWKIPKGNVIIGTVAAIVGHKDYPTLLKAARIVTNEHPKATFIALGGGTDEEKVKAQADELGLGGKFIFAGFQKDVGLFLKSFDIFVLASKLEGLGTSILDAQSVGLPVIATKTGGIPEAVQDGVNGMLVPPQNPVKLAEAILNLINDDEKRMALGRRALATVENFDIRKTVEKTIRVYESLFEKQPVS